MIHRDKRTHKSWVKMRERCRCKTHKYFYNYGGRGIKICKRWDLYKNFLDDMGIRPPNKSLDRINNDIGYSKNNCRWSSRKEQSRNKRNNIYLNIDGLKISLIDASNIYNIKYATLYNRLKIRGWSHEKAVGISSEH